MCFFFFKHNYSMVYRGHTSKTILTLQISFCLSATTAFQFLHKSHKSAFFFFLLLVLRDTSDYQEKTG